MLTDEQALQLVENMRRNTQDAGVAALCDWVLGLAQRRQGAIVAPPAPKPKAGRNEYMKNYMRRRRQAQKK